MEHARNLAQRPQRRGVEIVADADDRAPQGRQRAAAATLTAPPRRLACGRSTAISIRLAAAVARTLAAAA